MFPIRDHSSFNKFPLLTLLLIALNVFIFIIEITQEKIIAFIYLYAWIPKLIDFSNYKSLFPILSSMFLHGGWLHIIFNMWFLWIFGNNLEALLGKINYLLFYLLSGLAAVLLQYFADPNSTIPILGASGAIAGVLGGYLVLFPHARIETLIIFIGKRRLTKINVPAQFMLFYWFVTQLFTNVGNVVTGLQTQGGVAFFTQIGGFAAGWIMAQGIKPRLSSYRND